MKIDDLGARLEAHDPADRERRRMPLDLRGHRFATAMRGFDRAEVTAFLLEAADAYDAALAERDALRARVRELEAELDRLRRPEAAAEGALRGAQKVADDVRENAAREAARLVYDAEARARALMQDARASAAAVQADLERLTNARRQVEAQLEAIAVELQRLIGR